MVDEPNAKRIILGVMGLAQSLGLRAIAEGVEVVEQVEDLKALGCEQGQGYYFARPSAPPNVNTPTGAPIIHHEPFATNRQEQSE